MNLSQRILTLRGQIIRTGRPTDFSDRERAGRMRGAVRLHQAHCMRAAHWTATERIDRHLARILAANSNAHRELVFSHTSAAALLGLPLYEANFDEVHVTEARSGDGHRTGSLLRHRADLAAHEIVEVAGLLCTSPERTILDIARFISAEDGLACADAYLRSNFRVGRQIDTHGVATWRGAMDDQLGQLAGKRGVRWARKVLELADARKDSVLESISHLRLAQLGFEVELQVEVAGPGARNYYVDFEFRGLQLFGECDGKSKYTDEDQMQGLSPAEIAYREKRRQDWICGKTNKALIRWGYADVRTASEFGRRLRAFNVPIPGLGCGGESS